jgi:hypothetical protein
VVLSIEIDHGAVGDLLIDCGFLPAWDAQDRIKLRDALQEALDYWSTA